MNILIVASFFTGLDVRSIIIIFLSLILFVLFMIKGERLLKYNGKQERINKSPFRIFTLNNGRGTSFPSENVILRPGEVSSRQKKFGQKVYFVPGIIVFVFLVIFFASRFINR